MFRKSKTAIVIAFIISLVISSFTVNAADTKSQSKAAVKQSNVFMWEITPKVDKTHKKKLYLLGSVHAAQDSLYPLDKRIEDGFKKSANLVVEADAEKLTPADAQRYLMQYGMYTGKETLQDNLTPEMYTQLAGAFKELGVDIEALKVFKPWVISLQLSTLKIMQAGYKADNGIDMYFLKKAKEQKKSVLELESADFQMKLLSGFSKELQIMDLKTTLDSKESTLESIDKMFRLWKKGDANGFSNYIFAGLKTDKAMASYYQKIFFDRNVNMVKKIEGYLKTDKTHFVIAGAGHMVGDKGIVNLLKKKGYNVKQL